MYKRDSRHEEETPDEAGLPRLRPPARPRRAARKKPRKPPPLAPREGRYNDEIPDPDSEVAVPE